MNTTENQRFNDDIRPLSQAELIEISGGQMDEEPPASVMGGLYPEISNDPP